MAALCFKQRSFQFVITYIWWQKRPLGLLQRPHRKFRASIQDMVGWRDAWNSRLREIGNNYHFDGKRLKLSCSNILGMPKSKTYQGRGQGKRKCIVSPRLHFRSYYINVIDNTAIFFKLLKNTFWKQTKILTNSSKICCVILGNVKFIVQMTCIVWVEK